MKQETTTLTKKKQGGHFTMRVNIPLSDIDHRVTLILFDTAGSDKTTLVLLYSLSLTDMWVAEG